MLRCLLPSRIPSRNEEIETLQTEGPFNYDSTQEIKPLGNEKLSRFEMVIRRVNA